ncbi:MAG: acetyl-CoA C-acetyltransferase [Acidobacteria bacterium]|nr:acetyl-CoA C-acetyltransferase [Acidobacteriota bacterium]MYA46348.1 acetyl-CoA C-acetyltransferase [Acidobacteriota bacterium]MYI37568.1 acetyl-CoA C-acetyltransferase [Acidobacteriota bacterium]
MDIVLAGARRTTIGRFGGELASLTAPELGAAAARSALEEAGVPADAVDEVIFGNARQAGVGPNPARQVGRRAGLADRVPARTVNQACASGLRAILDAAADIRIGDARTVLAGGTESMSNTPFLLPSARWGQRFGDGPLDDGMYRDGFHCPLADQLMGETAETLADQYGLSRAVCDEYAAVSQNRAEAARAAGRFDGEIAPVTVTARKGAVEIARDEYPRDGVTAESLAKLKPVFRQDGVVHAGNSSGITDGGAAVVVLSSDRASELGVEPMARLAGYATAGVDPRVMGIGPVPAVRDLLGRTGLSLDDIALVELNEAFAPQVLACARDLDLDPERLNVNGGAIALGHPIGATGARIVVTLLHEMERRDARYGIATLCVSGGMGVAALFER